MRLPSRAPTEKQGARGQHRHQVSQRENSISQVHYANGSPPEPDTLAGLCWSKRVSRENWRAHAKPVSYSAKWAQAHLVSHLFLSSHIDNYLQPSHRRRKYHKNQSIPSADHCHQSVAPPLPRDARTHCSSSSGGCGRQDGRKIVRREGMSFLG